MLQVIVYEKVVSEKVVLDCSQVGKSLTPKRVYMFVY